MQVGQYVRLYKAAAYFGVITKVNAKSFWVAHNLNGKTKFKIGASRFYKCEHNVFECTLIDVGTEREQMAIRYCNKE
jgi:hypothetical protein